MTEPIPIPKPAGDLASFNAAPPGGTGAPSTQPAAAQKPAGPIRLFYSYSHKDEVARRTGGASVSLEAAGLISGWHDRRIGAGEEWKGQLDKNLEEAQIILLLISPSFLASDYCYDIETKRALDAMTKARRR